ncbi:MAG: hypothetical protein Ta2G_07970 [Termitinemataceae bacterium]|nr:MAG: hypothetical protein Ta2G_07970 [Termitinemataceae bacterium]
MLKPNIILDRSTTASMFKLVFNFRLTRVCARIVWTVISKFFILQQKAVMNPKKYKVTNVDHPLDSFIPFDSSYADIYMDFSPFWIRCQVFLLEKFGKNAVAHIKEFIFSLIELYNKAAEIYVCNFSTTTRPSSKDCMTVRFIHKVDPHLMCIPSLHIIVVTWTYIKMNAILKDLNCCREYDEDIAYLKTHALKIADSVLYMKQHSINCIPAALYLLTCFDPVLVQKEEALDFIDKMLNDSTDINPEKITAIRAYMKNLYITFLNQNEVSDDWKIPLLDFLRDYKSC